MEVNTPWYSTRQGEEVYHNNTICTEGNNIEPYNVERGTGNKRLCQHCQRLNRQSKYFGGGLISGFAPTQNLVDFFLTMKEEQKGK